MSNVHVTIGKLLLFEVCNYYFEVNPHFFEVNEFSANTTGFLLRIGIKFYLHCIFL